MRHLAYMAHPLGPEGEQRKKNLDNAAKWFSWLHHAFPHIVFSANWIVLASQWDEATVRSRGLEIDKVHVSRADFFFMVGGKVSEGMMVEQSKAAACGVHIVDLTCLGWESPSYPAMTEREFGLLKTMSNLLPMLKPKPYGYEDPT